MGDAFNLLQMYDDDDDDDEVEIEEAAGDEDELEESKLKEFTIDVSKHAIVDYAYAHDDAAAFSPRLKEVHLLGNTLQEAALTNSDNVIDSPRLPSLPHVDVDVDVDVAHPDLISSDTQFQHSDPLHLFLPPPPLQKCSPDLQEKINKFLAYKRLGKSFNVEVRNRKDYRNPDFLLHAVSYQDIDEIGSCFSKDVFDPHGYDQADFFDAIEAAINRDRERKEQDRKKTQKIDFVSGPTQPATVGVTPKVMLPSPGLSMLPSAGSQSGSAESLPREGRQNKKSKWDKVDGDRKSQLGGGHDNVSAVGAALLSAANAGAGYAVYAQQKRLEAEERRSSDRKAERRT